MAKNKDGFDAGQELTFDQVQALNRKLKAAEKPVTRKPNADDA